MFYVYIAFILILLLLLYLDCIKPKKFPPGPRWYPIIGSALTVHKERLSVSLLWKVMKNFAEKYQNDGAIGFKIGKDKVVVALTTEAIKEMYASEYMDGRPTGPFYETRTWGMRQGVLFTDGDFWIQQKRFVYRHLKEFGFAGTGMLHIIQNETEFLVEDFRNTVRKNNGKALVEMQGVFNMYILNVLWTMMAGIRYNRENDELLKLQNLLNMLMENIDMIGCLFSHYPCLQYIAPDLSGYKEFMHIHKLLHGWIGKEIDKHKLNFNSANNPRDLMDVYLKVLGDPNKKESFTERQLLAICLDLFIAGSETTSKTINFAFLYMVRDMHVQEKVHEEIDRVIGRDRIPNLDDRANMPYCEGVVLEALRFFTGNSFGIPHRSLCDTKLAGYDIPKDTMVISCFYGIMFNKQLWIEPHLFKPERFIQDGKITIPPHFIPFGSGKHRCMGDIMARCNLFMFITTVLQSFKFLIPEGHPRPSEKPIDGATPNVVPYTALIVNR